MPAWIANPAVVQNVRGGIVASRQDIYEESSTQYFPLGTRLAHTDGRVFIYALAGASNISAGRVVQSAAVEAASEAANAALASNASAGATYLSITVAGANSAVTANEYADGYLKVEGGTYAGYLYEVSHHANIAANGTGTIYLKQPTKTALVAGNATFGLIKHPASGVITFPTTITGTLAGVAFINMTANYYGWIQTWGPASVLAFGTGTLGAPAYCSANTAGAVTVANAANGTDYAALVAIKPRVGVFMAATTANTVAPVFLTIAP
jgi:hypothetical protein